MEAALGVRGTTATDPPRERDRRHTYRSLRSRIFRWRSRQTSRQALQRQ
jgi:uncharacterized protein YjiS (DUF1127 family)